MALAFTMSACNNNRQEEQTPEPDNVQNVTQETVQEDITLPKEEENAKVGFDYGDDELGKALRSYIEQGYWFKDQKPELIENKAHRVELYKPFTDENGTVWQFAKVGRDLDFDGKIAGTHWPVLYIYEGEQNLKDAMLFFVKEYRNFEKNKDIQENMRTFFPREATSLSGLVVKDSYIINDMDVNKDRYEGKKIFLFGFNYETKEIDYMFNIQ